MAWRCGRITDLVTGLLRDDLQEHDREAMAALTASADANG